MIRSLLNSRSDDNSVALIYGEECLTYREWHKRSSDLSNAINKNLDYSQKNIGILLPNSINYAISYFACVYSKKIIVPIDVNFTHYEISNILQYCEIDWVITTTEIYRKMLSFKNQYSFRINFILHDCIDICNINADKDYIAKTADINPYYNTDKPYILLHTSGTTNRPKFVMLSQNNILSNIQSNIQSLQVDNKSISLITLPMQFGYCHTAQFLSHVYIGAKLVICDSLLTPRNILKFVQKHRITNFTTVPSILITLADYEECANYDYSSLEFICFGGGVMPLETLKKLMTRYPSICFFQTYGLTECSPRVSLLSGGYINSKFGSVGKPIHGVEVSIVNNEGNCLGANSIGEIVVSGENVMIGYYKDLDETNKVLINSKLYTGDLGYLDSDGFLFLRGRKKNIIICGGKNIFPEEIESILLHHPNIYDAYVYGKKNHYYGEVICADIVAADNVDQDIVFNYCRERLSKHKIPKIVNFVNSINKTYTGKVRREK